MSVPLKDDSQHRKTQAGLAAALAEVPAPAPKPEGGGPPALYRLPGPHSLDWCRQEERFLAPGSQRYAKLAQIAVDAAEGALVKDVDGNHYIDFMAGICVASLGHAHPRWVGALQEQIGRIAVGGFTTAARARYTELLASVTPGDLDCVQFFSGGAEAVEAALRLARAHTKNYEVISFWGGFHGKTAGVLPLMGDGFKQGWGPLAPGTYLCPYPDPYRDPLGVGPERLCEACLDLLRKTIRWNTSGSLAAIVVEPMQGTAGNIVPPPEFLAGLQQIAHEHGALLIADEMITGFGRTGRMFGSEHFQVVPDILTIGKGMGAGFPVSAVVASRALMETSPFSKLSSSSSSYGGNPLAAAACLATLETILEEDLVQHSARVGRELLEGLRALQGKYEFIGDVRGEGLLIGIDLVRDRQSRTPLADGVCERFYIECLRRGLLIMSYRPRIRINPPLVISSELAREGLGILDEAFAWLQAHVKGQG